MVKKPDQIKILHLGKYDYDSKEAGGMEYVLKAFTEHLAEDFEHIVILFSTMVKKKTIVFENNIQKIIFPVHIVAGHAPLNFFMSFYLHSLIKTYSPDIIHVHMPCLTPFFFLNSIKNIKTIVQWHSDVEGTQVSKNILFPIYRFLEKLLLKKAYSIIVTSPQYLDSSKSLKKWKKKCSVIPLGIESLVDKNINKDILKSSTSLSSQISKFIHKKKILLSVGRFSYYKGYTFLIQSMMHVKDPLAIFIIAGDGPVRDTLQNEIKINNLENKILLPGKISESDKYNLLSRAEIFCLPSIDRAEAFGISLVEAMQFSIPLVTTNVIGSGMNLVNKHNKTGLKVPPKDSVALALAFNFLLKNPAVANQLGNNAYSRYLNFFQLKDMASKIKDHYLKILN